VSRGPARRSRSNAGEPGSGHRARKRFGQHFLTDESVIGRIVAAVAPRHGEAVVEIGPGLGALTGPLRALCGALTVVELDRDLAARLRRHDGLTVVEADALTVDFADLADRAGRKLRLVGNLPYNMSTPLLFHLARYAANVQDQHFMLQKEVALRIAAPPGGKDYGRLSVMLQWRYRIESQFVVPAEAFDPVPRVESAFLRMEPLPPDPAVDAARLHELVAVSFSQRRKLLRHTLGQWFDRQGVDAAFDLQRRAEEVPVAEYVALARQTDRTAEKGRGP
jgi:16S rRNA (adenine1518-N6/adenine1519-N6)-dimethyltransferase